MYIVNDKNVIRSVAETNKKNKVVSSQIEEADQKEKEKKQRIQNLKVTTGEYDVNRAMKYEGVVIVKNTYDKTTKLWSIQSNLLKHIAKYKDHPQIKFLNGSINQFKYKKPNDEWVTIAGDVNCNEDAEIEYWKIKNVCDKNNIVYINEGIGSVISNLIVESIKQKRGYLTEEQS